MQRVGEQEQSVAKLGILRSGIFSGEEGRLPAAVRMTARKDRPSNQRVHNGDRCADAGAILGGSARRRRPKRPTPAKWQIEAQYAEARRTEAIRDCDEQRARTIRAGSMRENDAVSRLCGRMMDESANGCIFKPRDLIGHVSAKTECKGEPLYTRVLVSLRSLR